MIILLIRIGFCDKQGREHMHFSSRTKTMKRGDLGPVYTGTDSNASVKLAR